jgi:hypothetical protein
MSKAAGASLVVFMMGMGLMTMLTGFLGAYAEACAVGLSGLGLFASSQVLGMARLPSSAPEGIKTSS